MQKVCIKYIKAKIQHLEGDGVPSVDDAALHLVGGETELLQPRVIQQLARADVNGALSALMTTFKEITSG